MKITAALAPFLRPPPGVVLAGLTRPAVLTAAETADTEAGKVGRFQATITVYGKPDVYGRILDAGSLSDSIAARFPAVVWSHDWQAPPIGVTATIEEDGDRVVATAELLLGDGADDRGSTLARDVWRAMTTKGGDGRPALGDVSIGAIPEEGPVLEKREDGGYYWHFTKLTLVEWGPCLTGAHPLAEVTSVTAAETPAGDEPATENAAGDPPAAPESVAASTAGDGDPPADLAEVTPALSADDRRRIADLHLSLMG